MHSEVPFVGTGNPGAHIKEREYTAVEWSLKMKKINVQRFATIAVTVIVFALPLSARAQDSPETLYKSKCAACHGPDGSGSVMGKKLGVHDFHSDDVQKQTDAALADVIAKGRGKMPAVGGKFSPDTIKSLVAYIRQLPKK
jgi:mono/diheme cytochrome c family protein